MDILNVNTGDDKLDEAYKSIQIHISSFEQFEQFYSYFLSIVKTDDKELLNKWLLKVLFVEFKYGRAETKKHDFDLLLEKTNEKDRATLVQWLEKSLKRVLAKQ